MKTAQDVLGFDWLRLFDRRLRFRRLSQVQARVIVHKNGTRFRCKTKQKKMEEMEEEGIKNKKKKKKKNNNNNNHKKINNRSNRN